ncbi:hypothetical protein FPV67DRAFT_1662656 [Lyophyllum atratum]|nr:hypothetical protein FPV67DRAFT_1662656 [Lyophyllum atratum]
MNNVDGSSDLEEESQATQLLQSMLDSEEPVWQTSYMRGQGSADDSNMTKEATDSSPSRGSSSLPSYHFHGLAQTQTQHVDDEVEAKEGSQKENIGTHKVLRREEREGPAQLHSAEPLVVHSRLSSSSGTKPKAGAKAVSFQSPRTKAGGPQPTYSPARRNPTRSTTYPTTSTTPKKRVASPVSSQDSFGVADQDPEQQFLATSKQFNVPLSDLSRVVLPSGNSSVSGRRSPTSMRPYGSASNRSMRFTSPVEGTILVESTPSASGGSQSQPSQPLVESQLELSGRQPDYMEIDDIPSAHAGDLSRCSTDDCLSDAPSSSYYTHLEDREEDDPPPPMLEATQPSTQVDNDEEMDQQLVHPFDALVGGSHNHGGTANSTTTTKSRNLLAMIDPKKMHRYQHYLDRPVGAPQVQHSLPNPSAANDNAGGPMEETQPSFEPHTTMPPPRRFPTRSHLTPSPPSPQHGSRAGTPVTVEQTQPSFDEEVRQPPQRRFPTRPQPVNPHLSPRPHITSSRHREGDNDQMDIIPDSEPLRDAEATSDSRSNTSRSPTKKLTQPSTDGREDVEESMTIDRAENKASAADVGKALFPVGDEEEEEEDDEEDVPLAAVISNQEKKSSSGGVAMEGKGIAPADERQRGKSPNAHQRKRSTSAGLKKQNTSVPSAGPVPEAGPSKPKTRGTRASTSFPVKPTAIRASWETGEVPSSIPEQDLGKATEPKRPRVNTLAANKGKGKAATVQCSKPKRNATVPAGRSRRRATADYDESPLSGDDGFVVLGLDDEDDGTEPADEDYMDPDFTAASSRKRKRSVLPSKTTKANSKVSKKTMKVPSITPSTRQAKRLRSATSTSKMGDLEPTRVFALWKQDGHFYPGTVHSDMGGARYTVHFDDSTEGVVALDQMRLLDLRVGDDVLVPKLARGVKVVDVAKLESSGFVSVRTDSGITEVTLQAIKIASKTISYAWKDRTISPDTLVTTVKPERVKPSPTPSKLSLASGPSIRGPRTSIFDKTALAVTISSNGNWEKEKESVMSAVRNNGGSVINDWSDVIRMDGKHSNGNHRWVIRKADAQWTGKDEIERVFLVADDSSLKPKFLIALALGIPCLAVSWLHDSVASGEEKDWLAYMLPQGYSEALGGRASQQVDVDWGNSVHQLNDIMDNRVPCKLFEGKSILCVGSEMVPSPKGKKLTSAEEKTQEAHNAVTRIILAMGADRVEAVSDVKYASNSVSLFDFVVIKEAHQYNSHLEEGRTVHWAWVKDCLIASRLLPIPQWGLQHPESQDA